MGEEYETLSQIKRGCNRVDSIISGSDGFMYKCVPYIAKQLTQTNKVMSQLTRQIASLNRRMSMLEELEGVALAFKELTEKLNQINPNKK